MPSVLGILESRALCRFSGHQCTNADIVGHVALMHGDPQNCNTGQEIPHSRAMKLEHYDPHALEANLALIILSPCSNFLGFAAFRNPKP